MHGIGAVGFFSFLFLLFVCLFVFSLILSQGDSTCFLNYGRQSNRLETEIVRESCENVSVGNRAGIFCAPVASFDKNRPLYRYLNHRVFNKLPLLLGKFGCIAIS